MAEDKDKKKDPKFQDLADMLKVDGDNLFDADEAKKELEDAEKRREQMIALKKRLEEVKNIANDDDYMKVVLRELVGKGMIMLDSLQTEIEETPRGRDVETAAAMMSSINGIIDNINKIKIYNAKIDIEKEKLALKKVSPTGLPGGMTANQNILMVGTTSELMDLLMKKEIIPDNNKLKEVKADAIKTSSTEAEIMKPDDEDID